MAVVKSPRTIVRKNSTGSDFQRRRLNLIEGSNITLTVSDDSTNNEIDVTIDATGGGGSGSPGGSNTQVQFNDNGAFGGDSGFTYNKTTDTATLTNLTLTTGSVSGKLTTAVSGATGTDPATDGAVQITNTNNTGLGLSVYTNASSSSVSPVIFKAANSSFNRSLMQLLNDSSNLTSDSLRITNTAGARGLFIDQRGEAAAFIVDATNRTYLIDDTTQTSMSVQANNTSYSMVKFVNGGTSTTNNANVLIQNTSSTTTAAGMTIQQSGQGRSIFIETHGSTSLPAVEVQSAKYGIKSTMGTSGGYGLYIASNGTATSSASLGLASIVQTTTADTAPTLFIDNRSAGNSITIKNSAVEKFSVAADGSIKGTNWYTQFAFMGA